MPRQVHISKETVPVNAVLYRIKNLRSFDPASGTFAYSTAPSSENPTQWGVKHPLQQFCEDMMAGVVFPDMLALDDISTYDSVIAAYLFLFPGAFHSSRVRKLVEAVCLYDSWGTNILANVERRYLFTLQTLDSILPTRAQVAELTDEKLQSRLQKAVEYIQEAVLFEEGSGEQMKGVTQVHWENDRCIVFSTTGGIHPPNLWDGVFSIGKFVGAAFIPCNNNCSHVSIIRKTLMVPDLDFKTLVDQISELEPDWRWVSPLAVVSPINGTSLTPEQLVKQIFSR